MTLTISLVMPSMVGRLALALVVVLCLGLTERALALEIYGRPLPSLQDPKAREAEESLFGGYLLTAASIRIRFCRSAR